MNSLYLPPGMSAHPYTTVELPRRDAFEHKCDTIRELQRLVKLVEQDRVTSASIAYRSEGETVNIVYGNQEDGA